MNLSLSFFIVHLLNAGYWTVSISPPFSKICPPPWPPEKPAALPSFHHGTETSFFQPCRFPMLASSVVWWLRTSLFLSYQF